MPFWVTNTYGADALASDGQLLVVASPHALFGFGAKDGRDRWAVGDITSSGDTWVEIRGATVAYWAEDEAVLVDAVTGNILGDLDDDPQPEGEWITRATVNGFTIANDPEGCDVIRRDGTRWRLPSTPLTEESMIVTSGTWAWFCLSDGRLVGIDFSSADAATNLDTLSAMPGLDDW
jgi:hypothetical protein